MRHKNKKVAVNTSNFLDNLIFLCQNNLRFFLGWVEFFCGFGHASFTRPHFRNSNPWPLDIVTRIRYAKHYDHGQTWCSTMTAAYICQMILSEGDRERERLTESTAKCDLKKNVQIGFRHRYLEFQCCHRKISSQVRKLLQLDLTE